MTLEQVRKELKDVKLYHSSKSFLDSFNENELVLRIKSNAEKYDILMLGAPENLFKIYKALYVDGKTQSKVALDLSYAKRTVERLHKKLLEYCEKML